jgi:hypothetical protein
LERKISWVTIHTLGQQNTLYTISSENVKISNGSLLKTSTEITIYFFFFSCLPVAQSIFLRRRWIMPNTNFVSCCCACLKIVCLSVHALGVKIDTKRHNMPIISQLICVLVSIMCQKHNMCIMLLSVHYIAKVCIPKTKKIPTILKSQLHIGTVNTLAWLTPQC